MVVYRRWADIICDPHLDYQIICTPPPTSGLFFPPQKWVIILCVVLTLYYWCWCVPHFVHKLNVYCATGFPVWYILNIKLYLPHTHPWRIVFVFCTGYCFQKFRFIHSMSLSKKNTALFFWFSCWECRV